MEDSKIFLAYCPGRQLLCNTKYFSGRKMTDEKQTQLDVLTDIRSLMERSSRFISLSGLSGVAAGTTALAGAALAYYARQSILGDIDILFTRYEAYQILLETYFFIAIAVLLLAVSLAFFFTWRKARKQALPVWDATARRLVLHMLIPLVTGGVFCLALIKFSAFWLIAPAMLIFYGLALINAGKYTIGDIQWLGILEVVLGLIAMWFPYKPLLFWTLGFGVFHIVYGLYMYAKYDRKPDTV
jgi:hypothetical protein